MTGSIYAPQRWTDIEASKVSPHVIGVQFSATIGILTVQTTIVADDVLIRGIEFMAQNSNYGDSVTFQIIDVNGVYFPANTVISTPVSDFVIGSNQQTPLAYQSVAPLKLLGGLAIVTTYNSTGLVTTVNVGINLLMNKVLV